MKDVIVYKGDKSEVHNHANAQDMVSHYGWSYAPDKIATVSPNAVSAQGTIGAGEGADTAAEPDIVFLRAELAKRGVTPDKRTGKAKLKEILAGIEADEAEESADKNA